MGLRKYVEQILCLYNYIDGLVIANKDGYIEYFLTYRPDINKLTDKEVIGKHVSDIYPGIDENTSSILRVIKLGKPIYNEYQDLLDYKGQSIRAVNSTVPIKENGEIIGAIDVSRYVDGPYERQSISITMDEPKVKSELYTVDDIITNNSSMKLLKERIPLVAKTDSSVLIYGETGTGKELVAQSIHTASKRKNKRFVSQNCAAIPGNLLEGILFGTTKGAYTGAENKPGLFEIANGGTLFLDEINSMDITVQPKILKAIEEKRVTRLGGIEPIKTDIKIVSAVNQDPLQCVRENRLREDLFYRLSVVQMNIPPLRERKDDLIALVDHYIKTFNSRMKMNILGLDEEVEEIFRNHRWPGNVRELRNVLEGSFNVAGHGYISKKDIPEYLYANVVDEGNAILTKGSGALTDPQIAKIPDEGISLQDEMRDYEKALIERAIEKSDNLVKAAELLGISKQALNYKLKKHEI